MTESSFEQRVPPTGNSKVALVGVAVVVALALIGAGTFLLLKKSPEEKIEAVVKGYAKAYQDKKCDKLPDYIVIPEVTSEEIVKNCKDNDTSGFKVRSIEVSHILVDGSSATAQVKVDYTQAGKDETHAQSWDFKKVGGAWKIAQE